MLLRNTLLKRPFPCSPRFQFMNHMRYRASFFSHGSKFTSHSSEFPSNRVQQLFDSFRVTRSRRSLIEFASGCAMQREEKGLRQREAECLSWQAVTGRSFYRNEASTSIDTLLSKSGFRLRPYRSSSPIIFIITRDLLFLSPSLSFVSSIFNSSLSNRFFVTIFDSFEFFSLFYFEDSKLFSITGSGS